MEITIDVGKQALNSIYISFDLCYTSLIELALDAQVVGIFVSVLHSAVVELANSQKIGGVAELMVTRFWETRTL